MIFGYAEYGCDYQDITVMEGMLGMIGRPVRKISDMDGIHLFVLFGGEDISPFYYKQKATHAHASNEPSMRDLAEEQFFDHAITKSIPVLGICRGAQLACCLLGGKLWQDVENHAGKEHFIIYKGGAYKTNSYHHQMMIPTETMDVLAYADCLSPIKYGEKGPVRDDGDEAEIVFHPAFKVLMIQGHPEWASPQHDLYKLTQSLVKELLV
jgi:gamma-glutamyl-gamma-aminobutyrate hydrolase PuuD